MPNPRKFTDAAGDDWFVSLNVATNRRIREELDVDLLNLSDETLYARLLVEPELLVDVLQVALEKQAEKRELDAYGFAERLAGDVLEAAALALLEAIADFFPSRRRQLLEKAIQKSRALMDRQMDHAQTLLDGPEMEQLAEAELQRTQQDLRKRLNTLTRGDSSTNGPESAESNPVF